MKPLVLWARWHDAKIELHGRDSESVWGEFNYRKEERRAPFRFSLGESILETEGRSFKLDEAGIAIQQ
ncbi:MAG: hypothetical protein AAF633_24995 [Chloroflexota bacterium]